MGGYQSLLLPETAFNVSQAAQYPYAQQQFLMNVAGQRNQQRGGLFGAILNSLEDAQTVVQTGTYKTKTNELMTYSTFEILGKGAFGTVYGARNQRKEYVAIKRKQFLSDPELMRKSTELFRGELEALYNLEHPNIVRLLGVEFQNNDVVGLVMEYVKGKSLDVHIREHRNLNEDTIKLFLIQLVDAVAYMHGHFVVHRDIKSSNVMIIKKRAIKLIDFGMAKLLYANGAVSPANTVVGTQPYMAPEVQSFQAYDTKADVWSLGALIYEMATGDVFVHSAETYYQPATLAQVQQPIFLNSLTALGNEFLQLCLIRNPMQRPSAQALLQHPFVRRF